LELSYENNGKNYQSGIGTGYYISTNSYITTYDRRIGGATWNLGRNSVYTTSVTLTIPSNLSPGTNYWIGAVIDENNSINEAVEWNNATYIPIRVQ
jgi:CARDB protein